MNQIVWKVALIVAWILFSPAFRMVDPQIALLSIVALGFLTLREGLDALEGRRR